MLQLGTQVLEEAFRIFQRLWIRKLKPEVLEHVFEILFV
jgi:hypothetical protein